jgi:hypothetical protein
MRRLGESRLRAAQYSALGLGDNRDTRQLDIAGPALPDGEAEGQGRRATPGAAGIDTT